MRRLAPTLPLRFAFACGVVALAALLGGCTALGWGPPRVPPVAPSPDGAYGRAGDDLLDRADLQAIVDAQVLRRPAAVLAALGSPDAAVRARAAFALGSMQDEGAVAPLLGLLADADPRVRADAAFALGQTADSSAALALVNALTREADAAARVELLDALGKTGSRTSLDAVLEMHLPAELEPARALAVARYGGRDVTSPESYAWLAARLQSPDPRLREAAAYLFGRSRDVEGWRPHAAALRTAFMALRGDPARMHLALALGRLRDPGDLPRLAQAMLEDPDWRVRVNAARAYAPFTAGSPTNSEPLVQALDDPSDHVARTAAEALAADTGLPGAMAVSFAAWVEAHPRRPLVAGSLLPALARMGRADVVLTWLDESLRRDDPAAPYHSALALTALGSAGDDASLARLTAEAGHADVVRAGAAVEALKTRWGAARSTADATTARRYYDQFAAALRRRDLATTTAAAPILADSLFRPYGPGALLRETYAQMEAPRDIEPMVEMVRAAGQIRDGAEVEFLMGVALSGHPVLRDAAAGALDERLIEGIDVDTTGRVPPPTVLIEWDYAERLGPRPLLVLETRLGRVVIEMDTEGAPQTVVKLAKTAILGHFNGVPFHRVVPNFVVQGGDYFRRDGYGGPDVNLRSEFTRHRYTTGTVGMASAGKDTEGVQYFVTHSPTPHLDGRYTAFGQVIAGQEVADALQPGDVVVRARVVRTSER